jgi:hypothetical protein
LGEVERSAAANSAADLSSRERHRGGVVVDFDQISKDAIKPAIEHCGLEVLRGDEERVRGIIYSAMFAWLLLLAAGANEAGLCRG